MNRNNSIQQFEKAKKLIPGGVNSPVRAFKSVGGTPIFIEKAKGAFLYDVDGNEYIDLINSWGPMILGHAHPAIEEAVKSAVSGSLSFGAPGKREVVMAETITSMVKSVEMVRMVNSGTEATMSAIRVARGYTGKDKIIKFEGCYHGHGDSFLIAAGSGAATFGTPDSPGVTKGVAQDTIIVPYNDIEAVKTALEANKGNVAALIIEPVVGNMGLVKPLSNFLQQLREVCTQENVVLIFDEVMTGFRLAKGGVQELYNITPDLTTFGKIIGGGMPVGAYGGKREIMECVAPAGKVYQAGTLSGNPIAMAAGLAMLNELNNNPSIYTDLNKMGAYIENGLKKVLQKTGLNYTINRVGSMYSLFFTDKEVFNWETAKTSDTALFGKYFHAMLDKGVYLAPSQYESLFISTSITTSIADRIIEATEQSLKEIVG
jgi:glutamate-1-semialdehyde 2,1-aminomutase